MVTRDAATSRIFVVDEDRAIASTLGMILKFRWYGVTVFFNSIDAFRAMHEQAPHLLISAVVMPEMSGIDLAFRVAEEHPMCKVLLLSANATPPAQLIQARESGMDIEVLQKPVHPGLLLQRVESLLGTHTEL